MKIWLTIAPILLFLFFIIRMRKMIKLSNKIKSQLRIKDDALLMTKSSSSKAKESSNLEIVQELNYYKRTARNTALLWLIFILLFVIISIIIGISSVK